MHQGRDRSAQFRQDGAGTRPGEDKSEHGQRPQVTGRQRLAFALFELVYGPMLLTRRSAS